MTSIATAFGPPPPNFQMEITPVSGEVDGKCAWSFGIHAIRPYILNPKNARKIWTTLKMFVLVNSPDMLNPSMLNPSMMKKRLQFRTPKERIYTHKLTAQLFEGGTIPFFSEICTFFF